LPQAAPDRVSTRSACATSAGANIGRRRRRICVSETGPSGGRLGSPGAAAPAA
jgi:hypothetical protein